MHRLIWAFAVCICPKRTFLNGVAHLFSISYHQYRDQTWFSCISIPPVPWEVLKTEAEGRGFQHLPRDLANVNALKKHVRSLLLHKN